MRLRHIIWRHTCSQASSTTNRLPSCSSHRIVSRRLSSLRFASKQEPYLHAGNYIIISDIAIGCMVLILAAWIYKVGFHTVWSLYFVPWLVRSDTNLLEIMR